MKRCNKRMALTNKLRNKSLLFFGVASLLWFIFRTGTKPSRIVYPCQKVALTNSAMLLSTLVPLSQIAVLTQVGRFFGKRGKAVLALLTVLVIALVSSESFSGDIFQPVGAVNPYQEIKLALGPRNATFFPASNIYVVNGYAYAHVTELVNLMGSHGLLLYKSNVSGVNKGPNGMISRDDVVLIKINMLFPERGGTNTDVLKELIQAVVAHPDGFAGEIVVADNGQGGGSMDWSQSNAEDKAQSTQDVVNMFSLDNNVSTFSWGPLRAIRVYEYASGDMRDGYILYDNPDPETGMLVSYPKFRTQYGTYVSFKHGIWNGTGYQNRLKIINIPVLKSHFRYGVTASLKHYVGVQSENEWGGGLGNGHSKVKTGGMGSLMVETGLPTLNIIDAIWVNANPPPATSDGPETPYDAATRVNILLASTDPVALDYWAAKHVLVQAAQIIGYDDTHTLDPDSSDSSGVVNEAFGIWLNRTKNEMLAGGCFVTTDENHVNVYMHTQTVLGDATRDGSVDVYDLSNMGKTFGSTPFGPNWNPYCNFNQDNSIDAQDLLEVRKNFGKPNS